MISNITDLFYSFTEAICDLLLMAALLNVNRGSMRHPVIITFVYFLSGAGLTRLFPNVFGWLALCVMSYFALFYILRVSYFDTLIAYIISYLVFAIFDDIFIMLCHALGIYNDNTIATANAVILLVAVCLSARFLPLGRLFSSLMEGNNFTRFLIIHLYIIYMIYIGLYKYSSLKTDIYIPLMASFAVVFTLADIILIKQQHVISSQQHNLENYKTYQPLMSDLINDIRGKQHDFNNQITAIKMLRYTYTDYDSLANALDDYSAKLIDDYRETDLLKINLSVVAGFVYSKITEAQKEQKELVVQVASRDLKSRMPEYELIRIIGILIDNALESTAPFGTAYLYLDSRQNQIEIRTRNKVSVKTNEFRQNMFTPGYTTKNGDRHSHGYGLYNLKKLTDKYNGKIYLDTVNTGQGDYIQFDVIV